MLLTEITLKHLSTPGRYTDNQIKGLHLWVKPSGTRYWIYRFTLTGHRRNMSFGRYPEISLKTARQKAVEARNKLNQGIDPITERTATKSLTAKPLSPCFGPFALDYIETMRPQWRNEKHGEQWVSTIKSYAFPVLEKLPLEEIDTDHILEVLQPIWQTKPETASRLRGRLERILSAAITRKYRRGSNPALWKSHLENLLPRQAVSDKHYTALPYKTIPSFMRSLREVDGLAALALQFTILTASRTGETQKALRQEVEGDVWTIPGNRMKNGKEHQVPLCQTALDLLEVARSLDPDSQYLFSKNRKHLSNMAMLMCAKRIDHSITVHGFRSTLRDWVSEESDHNPEVVEMALSHTIRNKVEAAYRRGKLLERRRLLMKDWESYCLTGHWSNAMPMPINNLPERS